MVWYIAESSKSLLDFLFDNIHYQNISLCFLLHLVPIIAVALSSGCNDLINILPSRLMVGQQNLDLLIGVRIPARQPSWTRLNDRSP